VDDVIQASKDPLEVLVGLVTRLRAKRFKEAFNGLLQDTWAKVGFKRILNNEEQTVINLIHVQEGLAGGTKTITQRLDSVSLTFRYLFFIITRATSCILR